MMFSCPAPTDLIKLILVEDDRELASLIKDYLSKNGFDVTVINHGLVAVEEIPEQQPDMVILDIMLPGLSGMDVCREVRRSFDGPVIMLTALDEDIDQMLGLELGADDYIIKPVQPRLLLTRIKTLLRRMEKNSAAISHHASYQAHSKSNQSSLRVDELIINLNNRSVELAEQPVTLTTAEFELLLMLAQNAGYLVDRESIVQQLRGFDYDGLDRSIDRRISRLRSKLHRLNPKLQIIKTIRGKGYQMCTDFRLTENSGESTAPEDSQYDPENKNPL